MDYVYNFDKLDKDFKDQFIIFKLSSSVDPSDKQRAVDDKNIAGYLEKPLNAGKINAVLEGWDYYKCG